MKKTVDTSSVEYLTSFAGAILLSFGLGVYFSSYFQFYAFVIAGIGLAVHSYGMYKMYK